MRKTKETHSIPAYGRNAALFHFSIPTECHSERSKFTLIKVEGRQSQSLSSCAQVAFSPALNIVRSEESQKINQ